MEKQQLIREAIAARKRSYSPYSHFQVGAALLGRSGKVYTGCNIENAAYTPTNCAERTAFFKAISEGEKEFEMIAIVGGPAKSARTDYCPPCGVCRQVMAEFCDPKAFRVLMARTETDYRECSLEEVLPFGFTKEELQ
ncbi:cytidine deaminase [Oscillospiraceae bacterium Marseille-Q3528]|nr:cytidine deaminase [Oscillospiraceae bacterium Marseille-Q3528]